MQDDRTASRVFFKKKNQKSICQAGQMEARGGGGVYGIPGTYLSRKLEVQALLRLMSIPYRLPGRFFRVHVQKGKRLDAPVLSAACGVVCFRVSPQLAEKCPSK